MCSIGPVSAAQIYFQVVFSGLFELFNFVVLCTCRQPHEKWACLYGVAVLIVSIASSSSCHLVCHSPSLQAAVTVCCK
jgi:hypothetical protein